MGAELGSVPEQVYDLAVVTIPLVDHFLERLGVNWRAVLRDRWLECDSPILLHLLCQLLYHILFLERALIEPFNVCR